METTKILFLLIPVLTTKFISSLQLTIILLAFLKINFSINSSILIENKKLIIGLFVVSLLSLGFPHTQIINGILNIFEIIKANIPFTKGSSALTKFILNLLNILLIFKKMINPKIIPKTRKNFILILK